MVEAIIRELELRREYLKDTKVETIYFGGGTPSLLDQDELTAIFKALEQHYNLGENLEITLEANPDDLYLDKLRMLKDTPINRLSIGIQSFSEADLQFMNRAHNAGEATACIENALACGFDNLTVDLIYGSPTTSDEQWRANMQRVFDYNIPHISCYNLTVEPGTALDHFVRHKKAPAVDEEQSARQLEQLLEASSAAGYEHYEISNFAKPGCYSRHNSAYWQGKDYLGVGPSAHSFNGVSRRWNSANNQKYLKALAENHIPHDVEILTPAQRFNEYLMTGLRTKWGCSLEQLTAIDPHFTKTFKDAVKSFISQGTVQEKGGVFTLTTKGKFLADRIAMELFVESDEE
jgi:oxygen-independent coproporphyrinogen-3 oxidase